MRKQRRSVTGILMSEHKKYLERKKKCHRCKENPSLSAKERTEKLHTIQDGCIEMGIPKNICAPCLDELDEEVGKLWDKFLGVTK